MTYPKQTTAPSDGRVPSTPDFPAIEQGVLAFWKGDDTFRASVAKNPAGENGSNEFVFYDGPPFANGLPHYGHLLTGYVKDIVPRFQTMRGRHVERRFGWDTHGLPAELEAMKQLGLRTRDDVLELGIEKFNEACRASVLRYTAEWESYVTRQARWVDFDNDYKTLEPDYMESVIWAFKSLYDKGLVYEDWRVLPYCWNDETPLSNHELRMDEDVYQTRHDPAVTVGFRLETGELALVWTTTPWTLPSNLAVAVGADIDYVVVESDVTGTVERYVLAEARVRSYARELWGDPDAEVGDHLVERLKGAALAGRRYRPPFRYYADHADAFVVGTADFVTTDDGTGLVHAAGAFGEDDKLFTDALGIEVVMPVGADGRFTDPVHDYAGLLVFDANAPIIDDLRAATRALRPAAGAAGAPAGAAGATGGSVTPGTVLLRQESYAHSYPHCWRCRNPLIYKGVSSWFIAVTEIKERMGELNQQISWVPGHVKNGQFGKWLANARDWSVSRSRFWGSPIPIWRSDDPAWPRVDVYGSLAELERDFGVPVTDLHRPFIDELVRPNPDDPTGRSTMRRVEDVLDVWFDSGSMPYAQVHYPFENGDWFEHHYPGDFIVEYVPQIRGWFYTMHVLATALFDRPAFLSCICHGTVLGNDGRKMSKSLRNYPDVREVFDRDGADAMRWFLMSSPVLRGGDLLVTEQGIREGVRQVQIPLWNAWYFFSLYANAARGGRGYDARPVGPDDHDRLDVLDRYVLAKLDELTGAVGDALEALDVAAACDLTRGFLDVLSNWYIRRSRDRFWSGEGEASEAAFDTLYTVLETTMRVVAPLLPLTAEEIWRGLTGGRSVHLEDWPTQGAGAPALSAAMDRVREVCSAASALRKSTNLRVRLPLARLTVVLDRADDLRAYSSIVADELNVKDVVWTDVGSAGADGLALAQTLTVHARAAGPRLGRDVQQAIRASKSGDWSAAEDGSVVAGGIALVEGEYTLATTVATAGPDDRRAVAVLPGGGFVVLDTAVTPELAAEGLARDVVRAVQQARRDAGLDVGDRIALTVAGADDVRLAVDAHAVLITDETLASRLDVVAELPDAVSVQVGDHQAVQVRVVRA